MPGNPTPGQIRMTKTSEDQSSIPSQPALASKGDHSCTMRSWSDTALSRNQDQDHHQPPLQESSKTLASEQAVSIRNRLCQQGKGFLNHRGDDRTLLVADDTHPAQPSRLSIHRHDRHHQGQISTAPRQCPFDAGCDSEEKRFLYRSKNSRTLRSCLPPKASILLCRILDIKSKTRQKPPEIFLRRHHHRHLLPPPVSKSWAQRPRHPDQTTHHPSPSSPGQGDQGTQTRPFTTHRPPSPGHGDQDAYTLTAHHTSPLNLQVLGLQTQEQQPPPPPGASHLHRRRLRSSWLLCVGSESRSGEGEGRAKQPPPLSRLPCGSSTRGRKEVVFVVSAAR
jgi:hypothetical protein